MFNWLRNLFSQSEQPVKDFSDVGIAQSSPVAKKAEAPAAKKATVKKADLAKMTKEKLEAFAKENYKVDIDRRKKKADLVDEVFKLSKK